MKTAHLFSRLFVLISFIGVVPFLGNAQEKDEMPQYQTLFGTNISYGGYGSLMFGYTKVGDYDAFASGFRGAWIVGHSIALGIEGSGFISELTTGILPDEEYSYITGGYGGLLIEPILFAMKPLHVSLPVVMGAGAVVFESNNNTYPDYYSSYHNNYYHTDYDQFFVLEPGIELEFNLTRFFRLALGGKYRFTSDIELTSRNINNESLTILDNNDLNSYTFYLGLKFGKF
jgi:hypothetical protein